MMLARRKNAKKKELEEEKRKKQAAQAFSKFFVPKRKADTPMVADDDTSKDSAESVDSVGVKSNFMPFQVRERMKMAPCVRLQIGKDKLRALDELLKSDKPRGELYVNQLNSGLHKPLSTQNTWPMEDKDSDVIAVGELLVMMFMNSCDNFSIFR